MRHRIVSLLFVCMLAATAIGNDVIISTSVPSGNQGSTLGFSSDSAIAFNTNDLSTAMLLLTTEANMDAFHVRSDGTFLVSNQTSFNLGGMAFQDGQIANYDPATDTATLFLDFEALLDPSGDIDIDAISELDDGQIVFSTLNPSAINVGPNAGLAFNENDVMIYNPTTMVAGVYMSSAVITNGDNFNNVDGVSVLSDDLIALSVGTGGVTDIRIGGVDFQRNDVVVYDRQNDTAEIIVEGSTVFVGPPSPTIDALHVIPAVPEPAGWALVVGGCLYVLRRRR